VPSPLPLLMVPVQSAPVHTVHGPTWDIVNWGPGLATITNRNSDCSVQVTGMCSCTGSNDRRKREESTFESPVMGT